MAETDDDPCDTEESTRPISIPAYPPPYLPPPMPPVSRLSSMIERWRVPVITTLVAVFIIFSILDVSSLFFHPAQSPGATRPLIVNAQLVNGATPAPHPDLGLAPELLAIACGKTGRVLVTNRSARPLQWTVTTNDSALAFPANTPHSSLLAPGQSITLTVMAFSQPGTYLLHVTDDHGEATDVPVQISC